MKFWEVVVRVEHECKFIVQAETEDEAHDLPSDHPNCRQIGSFEPIEYANEEVVSVKELTEEEGKKEIAWRERIAKRQTEWKKAVEEFDQAKAASKCAEVIIDEPQT